MTPPLPHHQRHGQVCDASLGMATAHGSRETECPPRGQAPPPCLDFTRARSKPSPHRAVLRLTQDPGERP